MDNNKKEIFTLDNGIKVLIIPLNTQLTHVGVNIKLGDSHEKPSEMEVTHYMEHIMAKFTSDKYGDYKKINNELYKRGAYTNAFVNRDTTGFFISGLYKDFEFYLDLLSNTISNFKIEKSIINQEKNAVIQELRNYMMHNDYLFSIKIWKYMYPKFFYQADYKKHINHIKKYDVSKIKNFIKSHILLHNILLSISCPLNKINITKKLVKKYFSFKNNNKNGIITYPNYQLNNNLFKIIFIKNHVNTDNTIIKLFLEIHIEIYSKFHLSLEIFKMAFFNFETGIFYKVFRDQLGLIYNIDMSLDVNIQNPDISYVNISSNVKNNKIADFMNIFIKLIKGLTLSRNDFDDTINIIILNHEYLKFNDLTSYNTYYQQFIINNKPIIESTEVIKRFKKLSYNETLY